MALIPGPLDDRRLADGLTDVYSGESGAGFSVSQNVFALYGPVGLAPFYVPARISVGKEREVDREESFCHGEDVTDMGAKNRDIHVSGLLLQSELQTFNDLLDSGEKHELITPAWSGEVLVADGDLDGPKGTDSRTREWLFQFALNLVSTGLDETGPSDNGILNDGLPSPGAGGGQ